MNDLLRTAERAIRAGEKRAMRFFTYKKTNGYSYKKHREIVTNADIETNEAIIQILRHKTPDIPILSEEGGTITEDNISTSKRAWVLDPIDGTTNFTARLPLWGISLALLERGKPVLGIISLPALGQEYRAVKNHGAWMGKQKLHVSKTTLLNDALALLCSGYRRTEQQRGMTIMKKFNPLVRSERMLGAAVVEATWVASGRADFSILHGVHTWDVATGALLVREAGGNALNKEGKNWIAGDTDILFSNTKLTKRIMTVLNK